MNKYAEVDAYTAYYEAAELYAFSEAYPDYNSALDPLMQEEMRAAYEMRRAAGQIDYEQRAKKPFNWGATWTMLLPAAVALVAAGGAENQVEGARSGDSGGAGLGGGSNPGGRSNLPDDALVCRGGTCLAEQFSGGTGVKTHSDGTLSGVSVNTGTGTLDEITTGIRNGQVGVTTAGEIRAAGGTLDLTPSKTNPFHADLSGLTATELEDIFRPNLRPNPQRIR